MSGTRILTGNGKMVIITTGDKSIIGKIKAILKQEDESMTPLQQKLEHIANDIGNMGLVSAIVIVLVLLIRFAIERGNENEWDHSTHWAEMIKFLIIGITVIVVAIPEGLPLAVTLSLAYSV